jgi:hypothetical protein
VETESEIIIDDDAAKLLDKVSRTPDELVTIAVADLVEPTELEQFLAESGITESPMALEILGASRLARETSSSRLLHRALEDYELLLRKQQRVQRRLEVASIALLAVFAATTLVIVLTAGISAATWVTIGLTALMGLLVGVVRIPSPRDREKSSPASVLTNIDNQLKGLLVAYEKDRNLDTAISQLEHVITDVEAAVRR